MRDLETIDQDIAHERAWVRIEQRLHGGDNHPQVKAATDRVDALLDERSDVVSTMQHHTPSPVDARLVR